MAQEPDKASRLMITLAVMSATLIQVLDTTIVNVALPHMQGELGATTDQISWVLTSYLVTAAIFMPLTGYFSDILGRKRYLLICIAGFVGASALCGIAGNVVQIVLFRMLQGMFGAALVPLSQAIMSDAYPPEERGKAMALWGLGVMVGPVLGPTMGGWLTEVASWRWTFYINVPVGALSWFLASQFVPETQKKARKMDWPGLVLLAAGVAGSQYALDRGNQQDWLAAADIRIAAVLGVVGIAGFSWYSLRAKQRALFDIRIFTDRNFATACLVIALLGLGMFGTIVVQPILLERLLNYPILTTGMIMAPRGIATAVSMLLVGRLVGRTDARVLVGAGMLISAVGSHFMTHYSLDINAFWIVWPAMLQGLGMGLIFVPLSTIAYATLPRARMAEAAGLYSLVRTMGSAIGISIVTTLLSRQGQVLWNELGGHLTRFNPAVQHYLRGLHLPPDSPKAAALIAEQVARQAEMLAMIDVFQLITWSFVAMLPLVFLLKKKQAGGGPIPVTAE
ncbi:DHA2 family efflux MFS transporter permease subunit [Noviherbaspirillum autotrophicum]|uniref:Multidrug MFS transporter n=1 Tax=Noviherbaspirillum autotrophicum TaxID=709839 RepID=A0A0C1YRD5_9BURK|nr:DHA2 family efflux MFS transporter permease subunit [Noviherbaspirillum autotrophicum]KIF83217.1 multidrug MFS transporter [Noviherbaspirillum autotrophicum]